WALSGNFRFKRQAIWGMSATRAILDIVLFLIAAQITCIFCAIMCRFPLRYQSKTANHRCRAIPLGQKIVANG
ncbi:hypothetical protein, partial [Roseovarius tolerans]|uniref:hypothetical protein n=1 Tax=Roseovarius tolerans TaxID=74031 RepID=UPI001F21F7BD